MKEIWKPIPGYENVFASSLGRIRRADLIIPPYKRVRNYLGVSLKGKNKLIHRLVAMAFHGLPKDPKQVCMHIDHDVLNNKPTNLRWGTQKENVSGSAFKCSRPNERNPNVKLTRKQVEQIRKIYDNRKHHKWGAKKVAKRFNIGLSQCCKIARRYYGGWA